jgi:hypothetical protein
VFVRDESKPPSGSLESLQARIEIAGTVRPGAPVNYIVELTNATTTDVALTPCPGYQQSVSDGVTKTDWYEADYSLNCNVVGTLHASETVRFLMRANVPSALSGPAFLMWLLDAGPAATVKLPFA